eukprot:GHVU01158053.1.p1 GENE.GHVU01158053.1~~GHVU01158053.1.p1  ORF type:complete len:319 (-),score=55.00 GHVU01158053.1:404-1360(-)
MPCIARTLGVPFVGCYSHKHNLAMEYYLTQNGHDSLLQKVHELMLKMKSIKNRAQLRFVGQELAPRSMNVTRWTSKAAMVARYLAIKDDIDHNNVDILAHCLSPQDNAIVESLAARLVNLNSVTVKLQDPGINLAEARQLVEACVELEPSMNDFLNSEAAIVADTDFESAVVKIINGQESLLSDDEKKRVTRFTSEVADGTVELNEEEKQKPFCEQVLIKRRKTMRAQRSYDDLTWVPATSNICERANSQSKRIMREERMAMSPYHLEILMFLKLNRKYWDLSTVRAVVRSDKGKEAEKEGEKETEKEGETEGDGDDE